MTLKAQDVIRLLNLTPHPEGEGLMQAGSPRSLES